MRLMTFIVFCSTLILLLLITNTTLSSSQNDVPPLRSTYDGVPDFEVQGFAAEEVVSGLSLPTTMAFVGVNDFLVLEKDEGTVKRVQNGNIVGTLLDVEVSNEIEQCMCSIMSLNQDGKVFVYLYYTESDIDGGEPIANRLYRYEFSNGQLINPVLLLTLPGLPGPRHNGGALALGPDNNIYITVGDVDGTYKGDPHETLTQNFLDGSSPDGRSGILRITLDGNPVKPPVLGEEFPLSLYFAYGIRNSFGLDFDPLSGLLWDTENGPGYGDEINLVNEGFNSGWKEVQGHSSVFSQLNDAGHEFSESELVNFDGNGIYSDPQIAWNDTIGPTAIRFLNSDKYGEEYRNDLFVSDVVFGRIYHFDLDESRTNLILSGPLSDRSALTDEENGEIIFASDFGGITDLKIGPDGYLYVVSHGQGKIYKIIPPAGVIDDNADVEENDNADVEENDNADVEDEEDNENNNDNADEEEEEEEDDNADEDEEEEEDDNADEDEDEIILPI